MSKLLRKIGEKKRIAGKKRWGWKKQNKLSYNYMTSLELAEKLCISILSLYFILDCVAVHTIFRKTFTD